MNDIQDLPHSKWRCQYHSGIKGQAVPVSLISDTGTAHYNQTGLPGSHALMELMPAFAPHTELCIRMFRNIPPPVSPITNFDTCILILL